MGGQVGEMGGYGNQGRWVAKLVARLLATAALWVRIQTSLKSTKFSAPQTATGIHPRAIFSFYEIKVIAYF
jgi:hypothetical protein